MHATRGAQALNTNWCFTFSARKVNAKLGLKVGSFTGVGEMRFFAKQELLLYAASEFWVFFWFTNQAGLFLEFVEAASVVLNEEGREGTARARLPLRVDGSSSRTFPISSTFWGENTSEEPPAVTV
jgi:hypothetical protein